MKKETKPRNKWTQWFVKIVEFILRDYKIEIIPEYQLYKEPMRIDIVVIKLLEDAVIKNAVMKFFRKHNILEFKGPTDILSIEAFDRVLSYFYAYLSKNSVKFDDATITFVTVKKPEKLFEILRNDRKYKIVCARHSGIYYIKSSGSFPAMQLVVNSELSDSDWLISSIRDNWTVEEGIEIVKRFEDTRDNDLLREVMFSLWTANIDIMKEVDEMTIEERKAMKFLDDWAVKSGRAKEWEQEGMQKGMQQGMRQILDILQQEGYDINSIKSKLPHSFA